MAMDEAFYQRQPRPIEELPMFAPPTDLEATLAALAESVVAINERSYPYVTLIKPGEIGFCRPCFGLQVVGTDRWLAYNPIVMSTLERINDDDRLRPGTAAPNAYHKDDYLAVLCVYDGEDPGPESYAEAARQLLAWVRQIEAHGPPRVEEYATKAEGIQAIFSGRVAHHLVLP